MSWSKDYKKSIDCDNPKGFSQKAHCAARRKRARGEETKSKSPFNEMHEVKSHKSVEEIAKKHRLDVSFIAKQLEMGIPIEHEHTKDKDLATDIALQHLGEIPDYYTRLKKMESDAKKEHKKFKDVSEGTLHHWFRGSKSKEGKPGWVQADGSPCANEPGETETPKCFSSGRLKSLKRKGKKGEALIRSAIRRKRQKDKGQQQKSGAAAPTNVPTFAKGRKDKNYVKAEPGIKEAMELNEAKKDKPGKGSGEKDACYHKVKSRYDVWPSAYASGALVKCRKVGADNWGVKEETNMVRYCPKCNKEETRSECRFGPRFWDMYSLPVAIGKDYDPNTPHPGNMPEGYDHEYSMARSELSTIVSAAKRLKKKIGKGEGGLEAWVQSKITKAADYIDTAADYVDSGEMQSEELSSIIDPQKHRKAQRTNKILNITRNNPNSSEKQAAANRLAVQWNKPKLKEETLDEKCWTGYKRKKGTSEFEKGSCVKAENVKIEDADGNPYVEFIDIIKPEPLKPSKGIGSELLGEQSNELKTFQQFMEDWQKVNRQDKTDGLSQKAVDAYRRENPGSKLQTAVTEKKPKGKRAKRRSNFCRRMKGMKSKLTSAKTARDPDSRINKALRRWNCN